MMIHRCSDPTCTVPICMGLDRPPPPLLIEERDVSGDILGVAVVALVLLVTVLIVAFRLGWPD